MSYVVQMECAFFYMYIILSFLLNSWKCIMWKIIKIIEKNNLFVKEIYSNRRSLKRLELPFTTYEKMGSKSWYCFINLCIRDFCKSGRVSSGSVPNFEKSKLSTCSFKIWHSFSWCKHNRFWYPGCCIVALH